MTVSAGSDAASLSAAAWSAAAAVDAGGIADELAAIVRIRSVTGQEEAVASDLTERLRAAGMAVETPSPDPASIREDPAWPGEETARTSLPLVIGRIGRAGGRRLVLSGHGDVVPPVRQAERRHQRVGLRRVAFRFVRRRIPATWSRAYSPRVNRVA